jgi:cell division septum initiation protein DivIVA
VAAVPELALREEREGGLEILQHENSELRENLVALQEELAREREALRQLREKVTSREEEFSREREVTEERIRVLTSEKENKNVEHTITSAPESPSDFLSQSVHSQLPSDPDLSLASSMSALTSIVEMVRGHVRDGYGSLSEALCSTETASSEEIDEGSLAIDIVREFLDSVKSQTDNLQQIVSQSQCEVEDLNSHVTELQILISECQKAAASQSTSDLAASMTSVNGLEGKEQATGGGGKVVLGSQSMSSSEVKISFRSFEVGDIALFLVSKKTYIAFHQSCPLHYLSPASRHEFEEQASRNPKTAGKGIGPYLLGKIVFIKRCVASPSNQPAEGSELTDGTVFYFLDVECVPKPSGVGRKSPEGEGSSPGADRMEML